MKKMQINEKVRTREGVKIIFEDNSSIDTHVGFEGMIKNYPMPIFKRIHRDVPELVPNNDLDFLDVYLLRELSDRGLSGDFSVRR